MVTAVLLDLDDTLIDTRAAFHASTAALAARYLPHLTAAQVVDAGVWWATDPGGHFRAYTRGELDFMEQRRRRVADLHLRFAGPPVDEVDFAEWNALYEQAFRDAWRLHDDAVPLLDRLHRAGVPHGVLTNSTRAITVDKLARLGLRDRLRLLVSPDDLGFGKPDPRVFALACQRLGSQPEHTAYVGDELDVDAQAAEAAGLVGIWLDRRGEAAGLAADGRRPGVPVVTSLADLPGAVDLGGLLPRR